jgi:UDP-N-acetylmuramate--alanine ligase
MIDLENIKRVYFLGIGGIGMSALAKYFKTKNFEVAGYDKVRTDLCQSLEELSCIVSYVDSLDSLPKEYRDIESTLVVFTPAVPKTNVLFSFLKKEGFKMLKRAEVLGAITRNSNCLAIAGTHGKTTISTLLAYVLSENDIDCSAFLGGISTDFQSNLRIGKEDIVVVEADEFDRSFLQLSPNFALVSSMDADHLDIYGSAENLEESFQLFADKVADGNVIAKEGLNMNAEYTYALNSKTADFSARNIRVERGTYHFNIHYPKGVSRNVSTGMPGIHNVENALAAFAMAYFEGVDVKGIGDAIASFSGVKRRFEYHVKSLTKVYIDDYAHHPKEIDVAIRSARDLYPNRKLTVVFQPHLFSRTRDFADDFAKSLSAADELYLLDIYAAREKPIKGIDSAFLLEKVSIEKKYLSSKETILGQLADVEILMTLGAGDINTLVEPIKNLLS